MIFTVMVCAVFFSRENSLLFGLMSVSVIKFVQPLMEKLLSSVPELAIQIVANVLAVIFAADLFFTVRKLVDFSLYMSRLKELGESLKDRYQSEVWFRSGSLREMLESVKERSALEKEKFSSALLEKIESARLRHKISERFIKKFPHMKSDAYNAPVLMLKENGQKIIRRHLDMDMESVVYHNFSLSPSGIISALIAREDKASVMWWRTDTLIAAIIK